MTPVRLFIVFLTVLTPTIALAQPLGTFRWQMQPYCNVVTLNVTLQNGVYRLDGTDDQCGAEKAASAVGTAFGNPDGSIGLGLTIVPAPSGAPVHIGATISLATLSGTWHDSTGQTGTFVSTRGAGTGGTPRPATTLGLSGVTLGFGLSSSGSPGQVSLGVDVSAISAIRSSLDMRQSGGIGIGPSALAVADGSNAFNNTALGSSSLSRTSVGDFNTAVGDRTLTNNTVSSQNVAVGALALRANVSGNENTALGADAIERLAAGNSNTAVGSAALLSLQSGSNNIGIGQRAGLGLVLGNNNTYLGSAAGSAAESFTARIGYNDAQSRAFVYGVRGRTTNAANAVPVVVDSTGQLGTISSSRRFKGDIADLGGCGRAHPAAAPGELPVHTAICRRRATVAIRPHRRGSGGHPAELVAYGADGAPETVMYHVLPTLLLAEVQRLERERASLTSRIDSLERDLATMRAEPDIRR